MRGINPYSSRRTPQWLHGFRFHGSSPQERRTQFGHGTARVVHQTGGSPQPQLTASSVNESIVTGSAPIVTGSPLRVMFLLFSATSNRSKPDKTGHHRSLCLKAHSLRHWSHRATWGESRWLFLSRSPPPDAETPLTDGQHARFLRAAP